MPEQSSTGTKQNDPQTIHLTGHAMKQLNIFLAVAALGAATLTAVAQDGPKPDRPQGGPQGTQGDQRRGPRPEGGPDGQRRPDGPGNRPMVPPLFAALDTNHDGVIDATEIAQAAEHLKALDKNGDGKITMDEIGGRPGRGPGGPGGPGGQEGGPRPEGRPEGGPRGPHPEGEGSPSGQRPPADKN